MRIRRKRPSGWLYGLTLIPVAACLIAMTVLIVRFPDLPGVIGARMDLDQLTRVAVPGSTPIEFSERGAYAVYYEYRSVMEGRVYDGSPLPPDVACRLTSDSTGQQVAAVPDYVKTNTYATKDRERVGVLIQSLTVNEPGTYAFSCRYADGRTDPQVVLAVGPNFAWEFMGIAARVVATILAGLISLVGTGAAVVVILIGVAILRHNGRRKMADETLSQ